MRYGCLVYSLEDVNVNIVLVCETDREEDLRYRNNKHDFNCESGNDSFVTVAVFVLILFSFKISVIKILWSLLNNKV